MKKGDRKERKKKTLSEKDVGIQKEKRKVKIHSQSLQAKKNRNRKRDKKTIHFVLPKFEQQNTVLKSNFFLLSVYVYAILLSLFLSPSCSTSCFLYVKLSQ